MTETERYSLVKKIREIEVQHGVHILFAVETGSRAYGCASDASDYDLRFVYTYPLEKYLSVTNVPDSIDISDETHTFDIVGWELRRTLSHAAKSNATFWDWMRSSEVILSEDYFRERIIKVAKGYQSEKALLYALYGTLNSYKKKAENEGATVKTILGLLRISMQLEYVLRYQEAPAVDFPTLMTVTLNTRPDIKEECIRLIEKKKEGSGKETESILPVREYIECVEEKASARIQELSRESGKTRQDLEPLDEFFRQQVIGKGHYE